MARGFAEHPQWRERLEALVEERLTRPWADAVRDDAQRYAPVDTGDLARSIRTERVTALHYRVGSDLPYAAAQEFGARPHVIKARRAKVLANSETGEVFGRQVNHPGNAAQPYLRPALYQRRLG